MEEEYRQRKKEQQEGGEERTEMDVHVETKMKKDVLKKKHEMSGIRKN